MNFSMLWQYMQKDIEADRFETKMRQSENRQTLMKQRKFIKEQQANMLKLENDVAGMQDRLDAITDEMNRLETNLNLLSEQLENSEPKSKAEADEKLAAMQKLLESFSHYEKELQRVAKDADEKNQEQHSIRTKAAKMLAEFNALKKVYDEEYKADQLQLKKLRTIAEKEAKRVNDEALLARYKEIKQHVSPPMAKLVNDQCSGCFMSLPGATLLAIRQGSQIVECDNCGRILIVEG